MNEPTPKSLRRIFIFLMPLLILPAGAMAQGNSKQTAKSVSNVVTSNASANISVQQNNDEATVKYNGKEVWKGKVEKLVIAVAKSVDGNDLAAAFEGKKLLWENVAGAGKQLEDERKKAARRLEDLGAGR